MVRSWEIHCVSGDATNAAVAQGYKAHSCKMRSVFGNSLSDGILAKLAQTASETPLEDIETLLGSLAPPEQVIRTVYADLEKVPDNCTGLVQK